MENKMMVMRRALRDVSLVAEEMTRGTMTGESIDRKTVDAWAKRLCEIISRDLAIPLRNCDVGTAEEQFKRYLAFCHRESRGCKHCHANMTRLRGTSNCDLAWAQKPYEAEGESDEQK